VTAIVETSDVILVHLFAGPYVSVDGRQCPVPEGSKRLLAFVALRRSRVERRYVAGMLWPAGDDGRAAGNLRSALWRLRAAGIDVLHHDKWSLSLLDQVRVDVHELEAWADRIIAGSPRAADLDPVRLEAEALDLLPGWYDDWTILERERLRQRVLHALEAQSQLLSKQGRHADAINAALAAIMAEPLRESAHRALIEAHLAEDNWAEAQRILHAYRALLDRELCVSPSRELVCLVEYAHDDRSGRRRSSPPPASNAGTGMAGGSSVISINPAATSPSPLHA
jgi:DNA-binding SARP family transcriptional activator